MDNTLSVGSVATYSPSSARWYGRLADKAHISAGPLELLKPLELIWNALLLIICLRLGIKLATGCGWGLLSRSAVKGGGGNGLKMSLPLWLLPVTKTGLWSLSFLTWKCYLLILESEIVLVSVRGFDMGPGLLDATRKQSISGKCLA